MLSTKILLKCIKCRLITCIFTFPGNFVFSYRHYCHLHSKGVTVHSRVVPWCLRPSGPLPTAPVSVATSGVVVTSLGRIQNFNITLLESVILLTSGSSVRNFAPSSYHFPPLGPDILISTNFSNNLGLSVFCCTVRSKQPFESENLRNISQHASFLFTVRRW
jgi:hypothetical protein